MTKITRIVCVCCFVSVILFSCSPGKEVAGTYRSNFGLFGMFGTTVKLAADSSLDYVFQGDLIADHVTGHYRVYRNKVFMLFDREERDSNKLVYRYDSLPVKTVWHKGVAIQYTKLLYRGHQKMFPARYDTEKKVTRAKAYHRRKKYLFFGTHYYSKRYYYKRV